jgi:hypothetical protein
MSAFVCYNVLVEWEVTCPDISIDPRDRSKEKRGLASRGSYEGCVNSEMGRSEELVELFIELGEWLRGQVSTGDGWASDIARCLTFSEFDFASPLCLSY